MTRKEYVAWCKERALAFIDDGDLPGAYTSMISDLLKNEDTRATGELMGPLGMRELAAGTLGTPAAMRNWINGF